MSAKSGTQLGVVAMILRRQGALWMLCVQTHHNSVMDSFYSRGSVEYIQVGSSLLYFIYSFNYSDLITISIRSPYLALIKLLVSHLIYQKLRCEYLHIFTFLTFTQSPGSLLQVAHSLILSSLPEAETFSSRKIISTG
jgi:hypothetical protein